MIKAQSRKGSDEMKKHLTIYAAVAALAAMLAGCSQTVQGGTQMSYIGTEAAENMAVTAAQVSKENATFAQTELDDKNGTAYYDVEFVVDGTHYTYAIDALTGAVIESQSEPALYGDGQTGDTATQAGTTGTTSAAGSVDEAGAKQIALDHAGVKEADTAYLQVKADRDDGVSVYDVEFYVASTNTEYDYEIDASTGEIRSYDHDAEGYSGTQFTTTDTKTEDEVKKIALAKVPGATENDIRLNLDRDDGKLRYEGKIIYDGMEYDFEIDAYSGAIQEWEAESVFD